MASENKNHNMIDLYKWICSLFVIGIHTKLFLQNLEQAGKGQIALIAMFYPLFKAAVPFFFIVSAYFAGKKIDWSRDTDGNARVFEGNAARVFKMYLIWTLIYLIPTARMVLSTPSGRLSPQEGIWYLVIMAFLGGNGYCVHLWFLLGLGISLVIFLLFCGRRLSNLKWVFVASIVFYGVRALAIFMPIDAPDGLLGVVLESFQFALFSALFYCTFGLILAKHDRFFRERMPFWTKLVLLLVGYAIAAFRVNKDLYGILLHLALPVFLLAINLKGNPNVFRMFRKLSTGVYLIHMLVLLAVGYVYGSNQGTIPFLATALISNLLALIYVLITNRSAKKA